MKKVLISVVMVIIMLFNIISVSAASENIVYPESPHNYKGDFHGEWSYTHEEKSDCLFITFSEDTYFGPGSEDHFNEYYGKYNCDYLIIYTENETQKYFADELMGKTIVVTGNNFEIELNTNGSGSYYGFKITDISTQGDLGDYVAVTYKIDEDNSHTQIYTLTDDGSFPVSEEYANCIFDDKAIIGWKDGNGNEYKYKITKNEVELSPIISRIITTNNEFFGYDTQYTNVFQLNPGDKVVLTPIYTPVSIKPEETFSFNNDPYYFEDGYKMTNAHAKQLKRCYQSATWKNQFGIIGVPLGALLPPIYQMVSWDGSCCGFPIAALMQHYGMIDLLSEQNVSAVSDIEPTKNITSAINFYNAVTPAAIACSNKAKVPGSDEYKTQIKNLYETVESGKPVVCFIHCGYVDNISFNSVCGIISSMIKGIITGGIYSFSTHCILLTGAYTDSNGNRVFIGYDENYASYYYGKPQVYMVKDDCEDIIPVFRYSTKSVNVLALLMEISNIESLGSIAWFDDISFLESFKADGEIDASAWYSYYKSNKESLK